jgi:hypothetical protein
LIDIPPQFLKASNRQVLTLFLACLAHSLSRQRVLAAMKQYVIGKDNDNERNN